MCAANIRFLSNSLPSLTAGDYQLKVTQSLTDASGAFTGTYFNPPVVQGFKIEGPQVTLGASEMGPCLPPPNSSGNFGWVLPQIQLNRSTLPWERSVTALNTVPWLALIVLRDDELTLDPVTLSPLFQTTVQGLATAPRDVYAPTIAQDYRSYPPSTPLQTMRMTVSVFNAVMPRQADLAMLCHCRTVTPEAGNRQGEVARSFSMVTANRFPNATGTGRNHCFLVSVEGYYDKLTGSATFLGPNNQPYKQVQLLVLRYWNFDVLENAGHGLVGALSGLGGGNDIPLRVPLSNQSSNPTVQSRLSSGYIPITYQVGVGAPTFAWYRGPFTPTVAQPLPMDGTQITSGDAAMIYAEAEGLFDLSYASAFEIGRTLAMADTDFAMNLLAFRSAAYQALNLIAQRLQLAGVSLTSANLQQLLNSNYIYNAFDLAISENIIAILRNIPGAQVPTVQSIRHPKPMPQNWGPDFMQAALMNSEVVAAIGTAVQEELLPVAAWLAQVRLLCKVPFQQLVPDQRMLPPNSARFFYLDQNWLDCLQAGAKSVGVESTQDTFLYQAMKGVIDDAVWQEMQAFALNLPGQATGDREADAPSRDAMSGMLIRSSIVGDIPGLVVNGYSQSRMLKILRKERLSDSVMLVIFLGIPDRVTIAEPESALQMATNASGKILLRNTSTTSTGNIGTKNSTQFPSSGDFSNFYRISGTAVGARVLNVNGPSPSLCSSLASALKKSSIDSATLALELLKSPDLITFSTTSTSTTHG